MRIALEREGKSGIRLHSCLAKEDRSRQSAIVGLVEKYCIDNDLGC